MMLFFPFRFGVKAVKLSRPFSQRVASALWGVSLVWLVAGCGGPLRPVTVPVTGRVTYQNEPVSGAHLDFLCEGKPMATATTDAEGRFKLGTFDRTDGAVPGLHKIAITKREKIVDPAKPDDPYGVMRELLPSRYGMTQTSGLSAEIVKGKINDVPLDLTE
jgi:hypothetical protein